LGFDAFDYKIADHLARGAGRGGDPINDCPVVAIQVEATLTTSPIRPMNSRLLEHPRKSKCGLTRLR
jgi:hypothetical protein